MSLSKLGEMVKDREAWRAAVHRVAKSRIWLSSCVVSEGKARPGTREKGQPASKWEDKVYQEPGVCSRRLESSGRPNLHPHTRLKAMAPHSGTLAWKILWTEEPGRLQSMG